jgi:hypothetical protein
MAKGLVGFHFAGGMISLVLRGKHYSVTDDHRNYAKISQLMRSPENETDEQEEVRCAELEHLVSETRVNLLNKTLDKFGISDVEVRDGQVLVKGRVIHNSLTDRIVQLYERNLPYEGFVRFAANLSENPSIESAKALFDFLDKGKFPLTNDGCFLGYKGLRKDFYDKHSGTVLQKVGTVVSMPREQVDDNRSNTCGAGLHVGTLSYARGWAGSDGIVVLLKVNPRDAVSVPNHDAEKLRTCQYEVVSVYSGAEDLSRPVYDDSEMTGEEDFEEVESDYREEEKEYIIRQEHGTIEERTERFAAMNRDDICREATYAGFFLSTNEARFLGKDIVVRTMVLQRVPFDEMSKETLIGLAVRRGILENEKRGSRMTKDELHELIQEDAENRKLIGNEAADD